MGSSSAKYPPAIAGDTRHRFNPKSEDLLENGNLLQYSCLENSIDRGISWATVHEVAKYQDMTEHLNSRVDNAFVIEQNHSQEGEN